MTRVAADRLWPVLLALALLLTGALILEIVASDREADPVVIVIDEASAVMVSDEEGEGGETGAPEDEAPLDQDHARARLAASRGELAEALALFQAVTTAHPDSGSVQAELGYWLLAADREPEALEALTRAAALQTDSAWVALNLGLAHGRLRDEAAAEREYRRALALRPDYGAAQVALGNLLRKRNAVDEAITVLERAAAHGSNDERARALVALGRAYLTARRHDDAARAFERAIERAPAAAEIRVGVARGYLAAGSQADVVRAIDVLERAATLAPDVPQVQVALARALEKKGDVQAAEAAYERAIRLDPTYRYARIRMFRLALDAQDFPRARMQVEYLLQHEPDDPEHHFRAGLAAAREGRPDEARGHYLVAIEKAGGKYPEAFFNLGSVERDLAHVDEAIAAYRKAIELDPGYNTARNNLGLTLKQAGRLAEAEATFREALARDPGYAAAWLNLGGLLTAQGRHEEAIACFGKALEARPGYPAARLDLGAAYRKAGRIADAVATYRALVVEHPRYVSAWYNLAIALDAQGEIAQALDAYHAALALDGDHVPTLSNLGQLEARLGHGDEARRIVAELLDHEPAHEEGRLLLAELRQRAGDLAGCAREARLVLARSAVSERAAQLLQACSTAR